MVDESRWLRTRYVYAFITFVSDQVISVAETRSRSIVVGHWDNNMSRSNFLLYSIIQSDCWHICLFRRRTCIQRMYTNKENNRFPLIRRQRRSEFLYFSWLTRLYSSRLVSRHSIRQYRSNGNTLWRVSYSQYLDSISIEHGRCTLIDTIIDCTWVH
jgi:hypothetical protein